MQFVTQYTQSGLKGQIPLYTAFTIDDLSLPRLKELALGVSGVSQWVNDLPNDDQQDDTSPTTRRSTRPTPSFYGAQTYDAVGLIDSAVKAVNGDLTKKDEHAQGDGEGRLQVGARRFQVRQQPHPDPELLPAGCREAADGG